MPNPEMLLDTFLPNSSYNSQCTLLPNRLSDHVVTTQDITDHCNNIEEHNKRYTELMYKEYGYTLEPKNDDYYKLYIIIRNDFPDYMTPTLVAHSILNANDHFAHRLEYSTWKRQSFKKVVVRVNTKIFNKIKDKYECFSGHENNACGGEVTCLIPLPVLNSNIPKEFKFAELWKPKGT